jgi:hypothetical protein
LTTFFIGKVFFTSHAFVDHFKLFYNKECSLHSLLDHKVKSYIPNGKNDW